MPELTNSTREAARRIGVSDTAIHKAERAGRIAREPNGQWDIDKTRRRLTETADPTRSPLAARESAEGTPFARLKVAQLALKVEAQVGAPLAIDTPIPTAEGWTRMGSLIVGDTLFDERGRPCCVTGVSPRRVTRC